MRIRNPVAKPHIIHSQKAVFLLHIKGKIFDMLINFLQLTNSRVLDCHGFFEIPPLMENMSERMWGVIS